MKVTCVYIVHLAGHAIDYFDEMHNDALHYSFPIHVYLGSYVVTYHENSVSISTSNEFGYEFII